VSLQLWKKRWSAQTWREYLTVCEAKAEIDTIRRSTHTGRPLGGEDFVYSLEEATQRRLASQKGGRKKGVMDSTSQITLAFDK
jgi:hypothetical protein